MTIRIVPAFFCFLAIVLVLGCTPHYQTIPSNDYRREIDRANRFEADGDYIAASRIYRELARKTAPPFSDRYRYLEAEALYQGGEIDSALKTADTIHSGNLVLDDRYRVKLLYGRIFLARKLPEKTLYQLELLPADKLVPALRLEYHTQRARAFSLLGNDLESAREEILAQKLMSDREAVEKSQVAIIEALSALSNQRLEQLQDTPENVLRGWVGLTRIFNSERPGTRAFDARIREWKFNFPGHPANLPYLMANVSLEPVREALQMPEAIGVLLPLSGPYARVGEAIRQGILIAQKYSRTPPVPTRFYNSDLADPVLLYRQVIEEGADFMIGPLEKEMLKTMAIRNQFSIPVLALNQLPELSAPNLYQFGLNPEDEVEQAANSAWFDGFQRAMVFTPATTHGRRLAAFFSRKWQQLGGTILKAVTYDPERSDYEEAVQQLLGTKGNGGASKSEPIGAAVSRGYTDFVFLIALPEHARLIKPLLRYYHTGNLAVYGTSQVYSGHENPEEDRDLSGIVFCDIPWLFEKHIENTPTLETVFASWQHPAINFVRLMALGFDAYNLLPHLVRLESDPEERYAGVTGKLYLTKDRRLRRHLDCAEFQNGVPFPRSVSPRSSRFGEQSAPVAAWHD